MADPVDDDAFMRKLAGKALWDIAYHEEKLALVSRKLPIVRALLMRTHVAMTDEQARAVYKEKDDDEDGIDNVDDFARHTLGQALGDIEYEEQALVQAHADLAACKALALRGGYAIDYAALDAEQRSRLAEWRTK